MNKIESIFLLLFTILSGALALYVIWIVEIPIYAKYMISFPTIIAFGGGGIICILELFHTKK